MFKKFLVKSEFAGNVLTLMTGTTIAQAIPIAISPILTRIYTPDDFGVLALFISIATIFGTISNGRYELAIILPEKDEDAINIVALGTIITTSLSLFLFLIIVIFHDYFVYLLKSPDISVWLYFVPLTILFIGIYNVLNYYNTRLKNFNIIAKAGVYKSSGMVLVQLVIGFLKAGAAGLIIGQMMSYLSGNIRMFRETIKDKILLQKISKKKIIANSQRYIDFPKYSLPGGFANILSQHLLNIFTSILFSVSSLGFYSLANRMLGMPTALIGNSFSQVYFQQATKEKHLTGKATKTFNSTVNKLFIIALPIFSILFFIVEDLFAIVFGEEWIIAGTYAKILLPLFFVRMVVSPVTVTNSIFEKQKISLLWQAGMLFIIIGILISTKYLELEIETFLVLISAILSCYYLFFYFILRRVSQDKLR
jgi:O-antigen/teichoic acid export membrane protein